MIDMTEAEAALRALLDAGNDNENEFQSLLESKSELIPLVDLLNHDVQWDCALSKFQITKNREVDLAYITKSTAEWRVVFVELERPGKKLFLESNYPGFHSDTVRAIDQVQHWKTAATKDPRAVREQLRPLLHLGGHWDTNPIDFRYVLVIGRTPTERLSEGNANLIHQLRKESSVTLLSWDSILRRAQKPGRHWRLNILAHCKDTYRFKIAHADTNIFATFHPEQITLEPANEGWFRVNGYDIDAWRAGKLLQVNQRLPLERAAEAFENAAKK